MLILSVVLHLLGRGVEENLTFVPPMLCTHLEGAAVKKPRPQTALALVTGH